MPTVSKPPGQRRRRNADAGHWRTLGPHGLEVPALPDKEDDTAPPWLASTRDWWDRIWRSPMGAVWLESDFPCIVELALLRDLRRDLNSTEMTRKTGLEDRFGLNPKARRTLQWEIDQAASRLGQMNEEAGEAAGGRRQMRAVETKAA